MSGLYRCAATSAAAAEPLAGTASTVRAFLLLEHPGPWGEDALRDSRLPDGLGTELVGRCRRAGVRPLLIRRYGRTTAGGLTCFAAYADPDRPWLEAVTLGKPAEVLDVDLTALGQGRSAGLAPHPDPVFLVCTHGRHDACCAELGRPLARALSGSHPQHTWECSHVGGDRFAGNLLVLPDGLTYGRLDADSGSKVAAEHLDGRLDLAQLRGRAGYGFATQAAEWHLRQRLGLTDLAGLRLEAQSVQDDLTTCVFAAASGRWTVVVRSSHAAAAAQLTCQSTVRRHALQRRLESIDVLPMIDPDV